MSPIHTLLVALLSVALQVECGEERRSDVRAVLGTSEAEPGFWPTRGRRGDGSSSEEVQPPFWAHRGREENQSPPCSADISSSLTNRLYPKEPKFLLIHRREDLEQDPIWVAAGRKRSLK